jgi:hypothetical protein
MESFKLTENDFAAIEVVKNVARSLLKRPDITPRKIVAIGNALYALERLPLVTEGAFCQFGITYRAGTNEFNEMKYIDFRISESEFEISRGGSVYDKNVGGDTISEPGWLIEVNGYRNTDGGIDDIEETVDNYLNLGAEITIEDESEIDYE